jgi:hypothetical protein
MSTNNNYNSKNIVIEIDNNCLNKSFLTNKRNINHKKFREKYDGLNKGNRINKNEFYEIIENYKEEINYLSEKKNNEIKKSFLITDLSIIQNKLINNIKTKIYSPLKNIKLIEKDSSIFNKIEDKEKIKNINKKTILRKNRETLLENSIYHELFELVKINMKNCNLLNLCNDIIMKTYNHEEKNNLLNLSFFYNFTSKNYDGWYVDLYKKGVNKDSNKEMYKLEIFATNYYTSLPIKNIKYNGVIVYCSMHYPEFGLIQQRDNISDVNKILLYSLYAGNEYPHEYTNMINFDGLRRLIINRN